MYYGNGLKYFLSDHLGSMSAVLDASGTLISEQRYLPFGGVRRDFNDPIVETDYGYTGQRVTGMGLMDYKARFYSPYLNRWIQPDSIIPDPGSSHSWNRYTYTVNNPINFIDPSGHKHVDDDSSTCLEDSCASAEKIAEMYDFAKQYGCKKISPLGICMDEKGDYIPNPENDQYADEFLEGYGLLASVLWEPADWAITASECASGNCSPLVLLGLLPLIPNSAGDMIRKIPAVEVFFSQDGISWVTKSGVPLDTLALDMAQGWRGSPLRGLQMPDGKIVSLDNRRLAVAKLLNIDVPISLKPSSSFKDILTSRRDGIFSQILIRGSGMIIDMFGGIMRK